MQGAFALLLQAKTLGQSHLHAADLRLLQVNSRIVSLATALEEWETGAAASRDLAAQYAAIYGGAHPMTGLQHLTLGRLLAAGGHAAEARVALRHAKELITLSHGADHPIFREQKELLAALDEP